MWMKRINTTRKVYRHNSTNREGSKVCKIRIWTKGLYLSSNRHTIQNSDIKRLQCQCRNMQDQAMLSSTRRHILTPPSRGGRGGETGGGRPTQKTTLSHFLSNPQYKGSAKKAEEMQIRKHILRNLFCPLSARTLDDMSA